MDTKANTAVIGAFTLLVLALGFGFVYWLARGADQGDSLPLMVIFNNPVTGLSSGSQVVFNGIKVGDVKELRLDPEHPESVIATVSIQTSTPIKNDTQVTLGFQGLTGVGYIEMSGGSPDRPPIWEVENPAVIVAQRSSMQDLMAGARTILARTDQTLATVEKVVTENADDINRSIQNVQAFTDALAQSSDEVQNLVEQAARASAAIAELPQRLEGVVSRAESLMGAVSPDDVRETVANARLLTERLAERAGALDTIIARAEEISGQIQGFTQQLPGLGEKTEALVASIDPEKVGRTIGRIDQIAAAIEPDEVRTTIAGLSDFSETLSNRREDIDQLVTRLSTISSNVSAFSENLPSMGERFDTILANVDGPQLGQTLDNINQFSTALAENSDDVDAIVADIRAVAERFDGLSVRAESLLAKLDSMAGEGTGGLVADAQATLAAVREAAETFNAQAASIGGGTDRSLRSLQGLVSEGQRAVSRLDGVISDIENNPSGFIFGGQRVPEYSGQRR